jgi:hypothetical protein
MATGVNEDLATIPRDIAMVTAAQPARMSPSTIAPSSKQRFPPLVKKGKKVEVPEGIIAHLTKQCGGNVHECNVVAVTSSGPVIDDPRDAAQNAVDLEADSGSYSCLHRDETIDVPHARDSWLCQDFNETRIVPTHYTIRTYGSGNGCSNLQSWFSEISTNGQNWQEIDHREDVRELNAKRSTLTFAAAGAGRCRFIRLVSTGRNHSGYDSLVFAA